MTRNKTLFLFYLLILVTGLCGCQKDVMIRVANRSDVVIHSVVVKFPSQTEMYGKIVPGAAIDYRKVDKAYGYAYIEAVIDGKPAVLQPIDYVGERLLSGGNYTYALTYNPSATDKHDILRFQLEKD